MMKDGMNNMRVERLFDPVASAGSDTAWVSEIIDLANSESLTLILQLGAIPDTDATFVCLVEDGNNSALSDNAAVADAFLIGTEAGMAPLFSDDNTSFKIGYLGPKRYVRLTVTPSNNTSATLYGGLAILTGSRKGPDSTQQID